MRQEKSPTERHALEIAQFLLGRGGADTYIPRYSRGSQKGAGWVDGRADIAPRISSRVLATTFFDMACTVMYTQPCPNGWDANIVLSSSLIHVQTRRDAEAESCA
jgi:hypothetical protein